MKTPKLLIVNAIILFLFKVEANAQVAVTNQGTFYVSGSSDVLYINGSMDNQSTSAFTNNGSFYLLGDLANAETGMATGTGSLYLQGTSAQTVSGTQAFKTYNLTTNNSNGITLNNDLSVGGSHTFSSGVIATSSSNYLIYQSGASYSGDGDARHVNGWVKKIGTQDFDFPVGNGTIERIAGIRALSTSSDFQCKYSQNTPYTSSILTSSGLSLVNSNEYWYIDKNSGGTAKVYMTWNVLKRALALGTSFLSYMQVAHYTSSNWRSETGTATGSLLTSGSITSGTLSTFSPFSFGSGNAVLPVSIRNLDIKCLGNNEYELSWIATHDDGDGTYNISYINNNNEKVSLSHLMPQRGNDINYSAKITLTESVDKPVFNLEYVDQMNVASDLGSVYADCSSTAASLTDEDGNSYKLLSSMETPAIQIISSANSKDESYALEIFNSAGQLVKSSENIEVMAGSSQIIPLDFPFVPQAMYFAVLSSVTSNKKKKTFKIITH
ncbi:MAG: hypothetical protein RJA07_1346 [Bacteroidota bacterium]|jgi:hypothetical protein